MAFAAFMVGLPIAPGLDDADDADPLGYLDQADPDLDDLREEFKPRMKERFEGWSEVAMIMRGGNVTLGKVYMQIVALMPFFRVSDAVDEMIARCVDPLYFGVVAVLADQLCCRLAEKPSKHYICDALDAISTFCKLQRKKISIKSDKKKRAAAAAAAANPSASASRPPPFLSGPPPLQSNLNTPTSFGGLEDVD